MVSGVHLCELILQLGGVISLGELLPEACDLLLQVLGILLGSQAGRLALRCGLGGLAG